MGMLRVGIVTADVDAAFVKRMTERLRTTGFDADLLSALEQFAGPMLDELFGRIATLETKAISIVGWATALLGFILLWSNKPVGGSLGFYLLRGATWMAVVAIVAGSFAGRARGWKWPTIEQWFCEEEFGSAARLRAQHLIALLRSYQAHTVVTKRQAWALLVGQFAIFLAGILVASAILLG
jgi:hypothetical protein